MIDFTMLGANANEKGQRLEQFASEFFRAQGFQILKGAAVGQDGGADLIVSQYHSSPDIFINWLVSCKNYGRPVGPNDELELAERVRVNRCQGFIGFYPSGTTEGLEKKILSLREIKLQGAIYDGPRILNQVHQDPRLSPLIDLFFPQINGFRLDSRNAPNICEACNARFLHSLPADSPEELTYEEVSNGIFVAYERQGTGINFKYICDHCCNDKLQEIENGYGNNMSIKCIVEPSA